MRIAIPVINDLINEHYGHTEYFLFVDTLNNEIVNTIKVKTSGRGHVYMANLLKENNVDCVICMGMGQKAKDELNLKNIKYYPGVTGNAIERVNELLNNTLVYDLNATCSDHKEEPKLTRNIIR